MAEQLTFRCDGVERYRTTARGETIDWVASYEACKVKIEELEARVKELESCLKDVHCLLSTSEVPKIHSLERIEEVVR
jgi:hypothetical protein